MQSNSYYKCLHGTFNVNFSILILNSSLISIECSQFEFNLDHKYLSFKPIKSNSNLKEKKNF